MKGEPEEVLHAANQVSPNLQFTLEKANEKSNLAFLDINLKVDTCKNVNCRWYQKPTDTVKFPNFRSCAPLLYKKNIMEGAVHRTIRCTSTWNKFDESMKVNRKQWVDNQYPQSWTAQIVFRTLDRLNKGKLNKRPGKGLTQGVLIILAHHP